MSPRFLAPVVLAAASTLSPAQPPGASARDLVPFEALAMRAPTAASVLARYGPPSQRVGADLWIYWSFPRAGVAALRAGYDTLVVHVVGDDVRAIRLVNGDALRALLRSVGEANRAAATPGTAGS
ncbi:MAG: hypothetical protein JNL39_06940 [Opitutaceae bacterium]|nr:hypothetical protein [Opitutaceae bacterium]